MPDRAAEIAAYLVEADLLNRTDAESLTAVLAQRWPGLRLGDLQRGFTLARETKAAQARDKRRAPDLLDTIPDGPRP